MSRVYAVKSIFRTLQGEGFHAGRAAILLRFSGCNLWTGREADRDRAVCQFCDTDFVGTDGPGGGRYSADDLALAVEAAWPGGLADRFVVLTGGEPTLQLDNALSAALHAKFFAVALETNGTRNVSTWVDWITVSPKAGAPLVQKAGHELKLVYPQAGALPAEFDGLDFDHWFLQPMDGPDREANTAAAARYCMEHPQWRLSLQTHKLIGLP